MFVPYWKFNVDFVQNSDWFSFVWNQLQELKIWIKLYFKFKTSKLKCKVNFAFPKLATGPYCIVIQQSKSMHIQMFQPTKYFGAGSCVVYSPHVAAIETTWKILLHEIWHLLPFGVVLYYEIGAQWSFQYWQRCR